MVAGAAYSRQARRLYVGNITYDASEANVAEFFNQHMRANGWASDNDPAGVQGLEPIVSVQVNHEKSYAFIEVSKERGRSHQRRTLARELADPVKYRITQFRSASEASKAMGFDGIVFQNQVLKIRRPKDYVGPDTVTTTHIPGVVSTNVPDTPNKIFIGGLPSYLNDVQVMELLQSFGELRAFNLVKEGNTNNSKVSTEFVVSSGTTATRCHHHQKSLTEPHPMFPAGLRILRVSGPIRHRHRVSRAEQYGAR